MKRYTRQLLAVLLMGLGLLASFNAAVDVYGIYRKMGLPHLPVPVSVWSRVAAAERLSDGCQVALLGSSRVMHGFGPDVPRWGGRKTCNGALGGTSMRELVHVFDLVKQQDSVRFAVLFLDFHMFHDGRGPNADFPQSLFNTDRTPLTYHAWALTSRDAVTFGFRMMGRPLTWVDDVKPMKTPYRANRVELYRFVRNRRMFHDWVGPDQSLAALDHILDEAADNRIQLLLVIPPVHAMVLESMKVAGAWQENKDWRRALVELLDRRLDRNVPLWDFSTYHGPSMAEMPLTPRDPAHPYWSDVSHQSRQLGFMTITRIRDAYMGIEGVWEPGFGTVLTPDNIEAHLRRLDQGRQRWHDEYPEQVAWFYAYANRLDALPRDPDAADVPEAGELGDPNLDVVLPGIDEAP